jgi:hypothetical protein
MEFEMIKPILELFFQCLLYGVISALGLFIGKLIKQYNIKNEIQILVEAAEMIFLGDKRGDEKKAFVLRQMKERFPKIDEENLNALIESFVFHLQ